MSDREFALVVENLGKVDLLDLESSLPGIESRLHIVDESEHRYGEPGTILAIMALGAIALPPVLLWLARHRQGITVSEESTTTLPGGTTVQKVVRISVTRSGPPSAEQLAELRKFPGVDPSQLAKAFGIALGGQGDEGH